jgi:hypothetical protein
LDVLWTKINAKPSVEEPQKTETAREEGSVIIKRTYEFAGQTVTYGSKLDETNEAEKKRQSPKTPPKLRLICLPFTRPVLLEPRRRPQSPWHDEQLNESRIWRRWQRAINLQS